MSAARTASAGPRPFKSPGCGMSLARTTSAASSKPHVLCKSRVHKGVCKGLGVKPGSIPGEVCLKDQGCPLSPLISAAMTHAWACWVFGSSVSPQSPINGLGYIDDRLLLLRANQEIAAMRSAVSRSGQFDRAFGLEVSLKKCAVVAASNDREALQLAASLDYQFQQAIHTLGVQATWGPPWGLLRFSLHKSVVRLRLMRSLNLSSQRSLRASHGLQRTPPPTVRSFVPFKRRLRLA